MSARLVDGRYRLIDRLGRGGIGDVWRATDETDGREVAVKLLRDVHVGDAQLSERFLRERRFLGRIENPHVCRVLGGGTDSGTAYLVVERIEGTPLDVIVRGGRALPWEEASRIIDDVLVGLAAVHAAGVVHRDLKPPNVMITDGRAKLIDFGVSKLLSAGEAPLTSTIATLGTPMYMAPEQLDFSATVDQRCDLYSVGTMLFRLLTGTLPFSADNAAQVLVLKQRYAAPSLSDCTGASWPAPLEAFVERMLARSPADRPNDAGEALADWRPLCASLLGLRADVPAASGDSGTSSDAETPVMPRRR